MSGNTVFNNIVFGIDALCPTLITGNAVFKNRTGKNIDATPRMYRHR